MDAAKEQDENLSNEESSLSLTKAHGNNDESITFVEEDWQALVDIVKILSSASLKVCGLNPCIVYRKHDCVPFLKFLCLFLYLENELRIAIWLELL